MRLAPNLPSSGPADAAIGAAAFILSLRSRGICATGVLGAMERVPREFFAPSRFADLARSDVALPLPCGQTMTAPAVVAAMLVALDVGPGHSVLEVGTGSGYVAALLARLGGQVVSVERYATLARSAAERLKIAGVGTAVRIEVGDGLATRPSVRYDRILVNGSVLEMPATLTSHLAPGGRLVGALAEEGSPRLVRIDRPQQGDLIQESGQILRISPLVPGVAASL
jgi:protein-L-isoaspartate(D-aspartate) O-methyltransferase